MSAPQLPPEAADYMTAMIDLIACTGSTDFQLRWSDDETPAVYMAVARYPKRSAIPSIGAAGKSLRMKHLAETAAALDPILAIFRLCELLIDGGQCTTCRQPTVMLDSSDQPIEGLCGRRYNRAGGFVRTCDGGLVTVRKS